jgi:hypothetical protein
MLSISADIMCCAQMVHLFSLIIYVNGKPHRANTASEKYIDATVPITKWESDTSTIITIKTITNKIANVIKRGIESSDIIQPP